MIETAPADSPLAVQLFGSVAEEMRDAAQIVEAHGAVSVDINMGCPVKKVVKIGGGSAMMTELHKTAALVRGMVNSVKIPVTAKMRLGWDDDNLTAPDLARALEEAGIAAIFVHGRTRAQGFSRTDQPGRHPPHGRGNRLDPGDRQWRHHHARAARHMLAATGSAGSASRGAFYDPWIFRRDREYLRTGNCRPEPGLPKRLRGVYGGISRPVSSSSPARRRGTGFFRGRPLVWPSGAAGQALQAADPGNHVARGF